MKSMRLQSVWICQTRLTFVSVYELPEQASSGWKRWGAGLFGCLAGWFSSWLMNISEQPTAESTEQGAYGVHRSKYICGIKHGIQLQPREVSRGDDNGAPGSRQQAAGRRQQAQHKKNHFAYERRRRDCSWQQQQQQLAATAAPHVVVARREILQFGKCQKAICLWQKFKDFCRVLFVFWWGANWNWISLRLKQSSVSHPLPPLPLSLARRTSSTLHFATNTKVRSKKQTNRAPETRLKYFCHINHNNGHM